MLVAGAAYVGWQRFNRDIPTSPTAQIGAKRGSNRAPVSSARSKSRLQNQARCQCCAIRSALPWQ
ncbi:hypothetical protein F9L69_14880 [Brucella melitensis]|uniref:Uncharacterized protein n=2 Tax=Brucella melitensis TaxID=29459 RepID=Q8YCQ7_BRUME|nr:hypothetical protein BMEII0471 [Brucella melitensis bv. 1 str. 16M]AQQ58711.1 hypothetical protein ADS42_014945 [Brucella melitensis]EEZ13472.1 predicted protein [Brucella melitensis bv. 1 str. Rev.1]EEZ16303.1 multidrug efflux RND membrane fusion protein MexE [Brucella melitensis bv. 2 str. 63/9]RTQ42002.1 hypothetical protein EJW28_05345 [Brucella abortus]